MTGGAGAFLLVQGAGLGVLHLVFALRKRGPRVAGFLIAGTGLAFTLGVLMVAPSLAALARTSLLTAILWTVLFGVGFAAVGVVTSVAWLLVVRGLTAWLERGRGSRGASPE